MGSKRIFVAIALCVAVILTGCASGESSDGNLYLVVKKEMTHGK